MEIKKVGKGIAIALVTTSLLASLTGCAKKVNCDITSKHAHLYTNQSGYSRYIDKEYEKYEGYTRNEEYIEISGEEEFYKFLDKKDMLRIEDNLDVILEQQANNVDYMEYRYRYIFMQPIPHIMRSGKSTITYFTYMPSPRYSWTTDESRDGLTGESRLCHYVYTAYKIEKDEDGKFVLIPSEEVDDITTVMDEYPYIKQKYYKTVDIEGAELNYEDGREEDLTEEEKQRIEEYNNELDSDKKLKKTK